MEALKATGLKKSYGGREVLKGLDLSVGEGSFEALMGPSGSGKSTFLHIASGLVPADSGEMSVGGRDVVRMSDAAAAKFRRRHVGVVFQAFNLLDDKTVRDNILLPARLDGVKVPAERLEKLACALGLDGRLGSRCIELSGGERQRIAIARAILRNPPILILDEATSALDTVTERLVQDAINRLMANRTTFAIAHRLSTIRDADLILVMQEGVIVERGTHDELYAANGVYRRLCDMQKTD